MTHLNLTGIRNMVEEIDAELERLTTAREQRTWVLETVGRNYLALCPKASNPVNAASHNIPVLTCTACNLAFRSFEDTYVRFGSECSYCGKDAGADLHVSNDWVDHVLRNADEWLPAGTI